MEYFFRFSVCKLLSWLIEILKYWACNIIGDELLLKVSVKETEVPTEKNYSRASIFATKASYISN